MRGLWTSTISISAVALMVFGVVTLFVQPVAAIPPNQGPPGPQGEQGEPGPQGERGERGEQGAPGLAWPDR